MVLELFMNCFNNLLAGDHHLFFVLSLAFKNSFSFYSPFGYGFYAI